MSHSFYKDNSREGDIKKMSHAQSIHTRMVQIEKPMVAVVAFLATS